MENNSVDNEEALSEIAENIKEFKFVYREKFKYAKENLKEIQNQVNDIVMTETDPKLAKEALKNISENLYALTIEDDVDAEYEKFKDYYKNYIENIKKNNKEYEYFIKQYNNEYKAICNSKYKLEEIYTRKQQIKEEIMFYKEKIKKNKILQYNAKCLLDEYKELKDDLNKEFELEKKKLSLEIYDLISYFRKTWQEKQRFDNMPCIQFKKGKEEEIKLKYIKEKNRQKKLEKYYNNNKIYSRITQNKKNLLKKQGEQTKKSLDDAYKYYKKKEAKLKAKIEQYNNEIIELVRCNNEIINLKDIKKRKKYWCISNSKLKKLYKQVSKLYWEFPFNNRKLNNIKSRMLIYRWRDSYGKSNKEFMKPVECGDALTRNYKYNDTRLLHSINNLNSEFINYNFR